jgi:hypothetical protein
MRRIDYKAQQICEIVRKLYGDNWQSAFARAVDLSRPYINFIATGHRPVADNVIEAIGKGLLAEATRLRRRPAEFNAAAESFGE